MCRLNCIVIFRNEEIFFQFTNEGYFFFFFRIIVQTVLFVYLHLIYMNILIQRTRMFCVDCILSISLDIGNYLIYTKTPIYCLNSHTFLWDAGGKTKRSNDESCVYQLYMYMLRGIMVDKLRMAMLSIQADVQYVGGRSVGL